MAQIELSRRQLAGLAVLPIFGAAAMIAGEAKAQQPHMRKALAALQTALSELEAAKHNKKGHRREAIRLIQAAIVEVNRGIEAGES